MKHARPKEPARAKGLEKWLAEVDGLGAKLVNPFEAAKGHR